MAESGEDANLGGVSNILEAWTKKNDEYYERVEKEKSDALLLAVKCINSGLLDLLDGVGSPLSSEMKAHHGVELFEMNRNWVETSQRWSCPCCERSKFEVSRVGGKGQILAKLVEHHDHMEDALKAAFNKVFVDEGVEVPTNTGLAMIERMAPAFSSYARILICEHCNNADASAKKILSGRGCRVDWQSFSIGQIRKFIKIDRHVPHGIDEPKLMEVWRLVRPAYVARMNLVYQVAKAAALQDYWYERYPVGVEAVPTLSNGYHRYGLLGLLNEEVFSREMMKDNISHQSNWSRWRTERKSIEGCPPSNYLAMILSLPGCARMWGELDDSWRCPICERSKFEVVKFAKGKVTFQTHFPGRRSIAWRNVGKICMACCSVVKSMKWELEKGYGMDVEDTFSCITPDELRSIITSRPHSSPLVDKQKAKKLVDRWLSS